MASLTSASIPEDHTISTACPRTTTTSPILYLSVWPISSDLLPSAQFDYEGAVVGGYGLGGYLAAGDLQLAGILLVGCDVVDGLLGLGRGVVDAPFMV